MLCGYGAPYGRASAEWKSRVFDLEPSRDSSSRAEVIARSGYLGGGQYGWASPGWASRLASTEISVPAAGRASQLLGEQQVSRLASTGISVTAAGRASQFRLASTGISVTAAGRVGQSVNQSVWRRQSVNLSVWRRQSVNLSVWRRHMSTGGNQPSADVVAHDGLSMRKDSPRGSSPGLPLQR